MNTIIQPDILQYCIVDYGALRVKLVDNTRQSFDASANPSPTYVRTLMFPFDFPSIIVKTFKTKKTYNLPDTREDPDYVEIPRADDLKKHTLSEIAVPIMAHGKAWGVLNIENWDANSYTREDQETLEALASNTGLALSRIRYEDRLRNLHDHAFRIAGAQNVSEIADYTLESMMKVLELELCEFFVVKDGIFTSISERGLSETLKRREEFQERARFRYHAGDLPQQQALYTIVSGGLDFISELKVPVKVGEEDVASLSAKSIRLDAFSDTEREILETLASHVASAMQRIMIREEVRQLAYKLNGLKPGGCYLSESHDRLLKAYAVLSMEGVPGLCIVRDDPQSLMDDYGIKKEEIVLLSSRSFGGYETLEDLQAVSRRLSQFLESGEGVVLLDGLEYLISRFGFEAVYSFVQEKRFDFLSSKAVLLVPLDMETIEGREKALLSSEFTLLE